jgi:hypothetical protein
MTRTRDILTMLSLPVERMHRMSIGIAVLALLSVLGCNGKPPMSQISGSVTFKGKPIPAGHVMFTPDVSISGGQIRMFMVTDGIYDSKKDAEPGLLPGPYKVTIAGYDGKRIPMFFQGKQIFNAIEESLVVGPGVMTKDFVVPDSAGQNVKIFETADY